MPRIARLRMGARIALAATVPAAAALLLMAAATLVYSRSLFEQLMVSHGASAVEAGAMFQKTVGWVALSALALGALVATAAALLLGRHLARPLGHMGEVARRLEAGDLGARVAAVPAVPELAALAEAFDSMAAALERQEQVRRDFVTGAAHELLTPLTNIEGYLEGLRDGVIAAEPATFDSLLEEARRLTRLSRALLQTAADNGQEVGPVAVDLARSVAAAAALVEPAFSRRGLALEVDVPDGLTALAVADHVTQVLFNLLQNAGRYSSENGTVRITAEATDGAVRVSVTNPGEGLPAGQAERVFERLYRVDPSRDRATGGAGIGLAIVKQVVEAAGGRVGVESRSGRTRFWFTLPVA